MIINPIIGRLNKQLVEPCKNKILEEINYLVRDIIIMTLKGDLSNVDLSGTDLSFLPLNNINFNSADLREVNLKSTKLDSVDLRRANLRQADLRYTAFIWTDLSGANLYKAKINHDNPIIEKLSDEQREQIILINQGEIVNE